MKKSSKMIAITLALSLIIVSGSMSFGADNLHFNRPSEFYNFYKGEVLSYSFFIRHCLGTSYATQPILKIYSPTNRKVYEKKFPVMKSGYKTVTGSVSTKNFIQGGHWLKAYPGKYKLSDGKLASINAGAMVEIPINVRILKVPTLLTARAGSGSVTLTYKRALGGTKHEIYRSTGGAYIKIKTTTRTSYKNTGLSHGRKYYYKIRSLRTVHGRVVSSFTKAVSVRTY